MAAFARLVFALVCGLLLVPPFGANFGEVVSGTIEAVRTLPRFCFWTEAGTPQNIFSTFQPNSRIAAIRGAAKAIAQ